MARGIFGCDPDHQKKAFIGFEVSCLVIITILCTFVFNFGQWSKVTYRDGDSFYFGLTHVVPANPAAFNSIQVQMAAEDNATDTGNLEQIYYTNSYLNAADIAAAGGDSVIMMLVSVFCLVVGFLFVVIGKSYARAMVCGALGTACLIAMEARWDAQQEVLLGCRVGDSALRETGYPVCETEDYVSIEQKFDIAIPQDAVNIMLNPGITASDCLNPFPAAPGTQIEEPLTDVVDSITGNSTGSGFVGRRLLQQAEECEADQLKTCSGVNGYLILTMRAESCVPKKLRSFSDLPPNLAGIYNDTESLADVDPESTDYQALRDALLWDVSLGNSWSLGIAISVFSGFLCISWGIRWLWAVKTRVKEKHEGIGYGQVQNPAGRGDDPTAADAA